ncbi:MAG: Coenzyme F420 hydrogenase/dehydrogenase, beta subunit C-terminal domain [Promethearchaeota archaeon]
MVQKINGNLFKSLSPKDLLDATYKATENFQIRAFFEAKDEIINTEKYSENDFYNILDAMIDGETERKIVLERLKGSKPLFLKEIVDIINDFPPEHIIRDVIYLKEQGYIEEKIEVKIDILKKKIKGVDKEVEGKTYFHRFFVKELPRDFIEHFFEPVTIVSDAGVCCQCGWCSSICPVNAINVTADSLEIDNDICMKCGLCYSVCPRTFLIDQASENIKKFNKSLKWSDKIGAYINTYSASTTNKKIKEVRQDGGVVTSILHYLLEQKLVDAIVAVQHSKDFWKPEPIIIENIEDLYKTGGTKYANSPSLTILPNCKKYEKLAFVGVPCMMTALEKGSMFPCGIEFFGNVKYKIGLFCMEAFPYEGIIQLLKEQFSKDLEEVKKMNIGGGKFIIDLITGETLDVPLKDVQQYARSNCHFCGDLTSTHADFSIGSIGSKDGWSSVITRSLEADKIFKEMIKKGLVESSNLKDVKPGQFLVEKISGIKRSKSKPIDLYNIQK